MLQKTVEKIRTILLRNIKHARKSIGLNQEALAEKSGLSLGMIKNIERGTKWPSAASIEAISKALRLPVSQLFLDDEQNPTVHDVMNLLAKTFNYTVRKKN